MLNTLDYISAFISLILGLGVASILANYADYLKNRGSVRWRWLHVGWGVYALFAIASEWWVTLSWRNVPSINYFIFLFMLGKPSTLFFAAALLMPDLDDSDEVVDLNAHYFSIHRPFFASFAAYLVLDLGDTLLKGTQHFLSLGPLYPITNTLGIAACIAGMVSRNYTLHVVILLSAYASMMLGIANALFRV